MRAGSPERPAVFDVLTPRLISDTYLKNHEFGRITSGNSACRRSACIALVYTVGFLSVLPQARADSGDTLNVSTGFAVQTDTNLFRLPANSNPQSALGTSTKSERTEIRSVILTLDKQYSLQRFQLNASYNDFRHQNFDYLNFKGIDYSGTWSWSFSPRIRGSLSAERKEALNNFADVGGLTIRNVRTDSGLKFDGEADLGAAVRLLGSLEQAKRSNEVTVVQEGDSTVNSVATGLRYIFPSGNSISYRFRKGNGVYSNQNDDLVTAIPSGFNETEHELRGAWKLTGKTAFNARIGVLARVHPGLQQRDYSGPVANLGMLWNPTAKIGVTASLSRSRSSYQTDTSSFITNNRFTLSPAWQATAHTSLRFNYDYLTQEYDGALPGLEPPFNRHDKTRLAQVSLDWRPRQFISVSFSLQNQRRSSNTTGFDFNSTGASIGAALNF